MEEDIDWESLDVPLAFLEVSCSDPSINGVTEGLPDVDT